MNMARLLSVNTALVFFILTIPWCIKYIYPFKDYDYFMIWSIIAYAVVFIWLLLLDSELMKRVPLKIRPSNTLFLINLTLIFLSSCIIYIFFGEGKEFNVTGLAVLPFLYIFYAWFSIYNHLSKLLTFAEEEKEIPLGRRIGEMVLFFFFFIGVWFLQPRIRKVLGKPEFANLKYRGFKDPNIISKD
jgi:hypothetical protein